MPAPTIPLDIVERAEIAVVAVISASADLQAITGKMKGNIGAWDADDAGSPPVIAYRATIATPGGGAIGDTREIMFLFSAIAPNESVANAMLGAIEPRRYNRDTSPISGILWAPALAALDPPVDGYMRNPVRRPVPWDSGTDEYRSDLEITLVITS